MSLNSKEIEQNKNLGGQGPGILSFIPKSVPYPCASHKLSGSCWHILSDITINIKVLQFIINIYLRWPTVLPLKQKWSSIWFVLFIAPLLHYRSNLFLTNIFNAITERNIYICDPEMKALPLAYWQTQYQWSIINKNDSTLSCVFSQVSSLLSLIFYFCKRGTTTELLQSQNEWGWATENLALTVIPIILSFNIYGW